MNKPELLCPAGDLERLQMALHFGADAVYLAGAQFGMRAGAENFTPDGIRAAVQLAHAQGAAVHVTCNTLPRDDELAQLPAYLELLDDAGVDAIIAADLGVITLAKRHAPHVALHVSTQFGVVNSAAAAALYDLGAQRVVLARELSLAEIRTIRANTPPALELEAFVHGAMCVSFSGRCLLSNYLTGRDANRGRCAQPCRWKYGLTEAKRPGQVFDITEDERGTYIFNSRDMCMIGHLSALLDAGITSLKIEGRTKSAYYVGAVTNAYRHALDDAIAGRPLDPVWQREVLQISHRPYSTGFYFGQPGQYTADSAYFAGAEVCAVVEGTAPDGRAVLTQRNKFCLGDELELLSPSAAPVRFTVNAMQNAEGEVIADTRHAMMEIHMRLPAAAPPGSILRKRR